MQQATDGQRHAVIELSECGSRPPHGPTAEEWNSVKDVIRQLYVYDQRPLKQVKEHLEANYNFHATYEQSPRLSRPFPSLPCQAHGSRLIRCQGAHVQGQTWSLGIE
jgi:Clr5 domain